MSKKYTATLQRGNVYYLGKKRFERGVPVEVDASEAKLLRKEVQVLTPTNDPEDTFEKKVFKVVEGTPAKAAESESDSEEEEEEEQAKPKARNRRGSK